MSAVEYKAVSKTYGGVKVLDDVSFTVEDGSFTVLCGPPRSGKSTLFRLLVGLEAPDGGRILAGGADITDKPATARNFGYVPQSFALYPHFTVHRNIAYPLRLAGVSSAEIDAQVDRVAGMLSITHLLGKTPDQLSGGEKQRVAIARGLAADASVFVLDDPLVGLDYKLRERLMDELKLLCEDLKKTFFYATSDSLEALTMAQSLVVLDAGRVVEKAEVARLYAEPEQMRSFELIGFPKSNMLDGAIRNGRIETGGLRFSVPAGLADMKVRLGVRPEDVHLGGSHALKLPAIVRILEHLGSEIVAYLEMDGQQLTAAYAASAAAMPDIDAKVEISIDPQRIIIFDAQSGRRLGRGMEGGNG